MKIIVAILLTFIVLSESVLTASSHLRTATGRPVSLESLRDWFPDDSLESLSSRIYEITGDGRLVGNEWSFDLHSATSLPVQVRLGNETMVVVDGKVKAGLHLSVLLHRGRQISYATLLDGTPIMAQVSGLKLSPLDRQEHPGVFVNHGLHREVNNTNKINLAGDEVQVPSRPTMLTQEKNLDIVSTHQTSCASLVPRREVELAIDFDSTYCSQNGGETDAVAAITALLAEVQIPYSQDTCVEFNFVRIRGFCNPSTDPYAAAISGYDSVTILNTFRNYWNSNEGSTTRDAAHLISGFQQTGSSKGIAYTGATCITSYAYGWSESLKFIIAHELGHNLGASHSTGGIMVAASDGTQAYEFEQQSIDQIVSYVDSSSGSCLATLSDSSDSTPTPTPTSTPTPTATPSPIVQNPPAISASPSPSPSPVTNGNGKPAKSPRPKKN